MKKQEVEIEISSISKTDSFGGLLVECDAKHYKYHPELKFHIPKHESYGPRVGQRVKVTIELIEDETPTLPYLGVRKAFIYSKGKYLGQIHPIELADEHFECDGRALSKVDYPELYTSLITAYNGDECPFGEDEDTFNIPDLRVRVIMTREK